MGEKTGFTFRPTELYIDGQKIESIKEVTFLDSEHTDETIEPIKDMKFGPEETYSFTFTMSRWQMLKCKLAVFVSRIFHIRVVVTGTADVRRIEPPTEGGN